MAGTEEAACGFVPIAAMTAVPATLTLDICVVIRRRIATIVQLATGTDEAACDPIPTAALTIT